MNLVAFRATAFAASLMIANSCSAQQPTESDDKVGAEAISITQFEGAETWKVYVPGELELHNENLHDLRVVYGATMFTPNGPLKKKVSFDVRDVMAEGRRADWLQWSFTAEYEGEEGYPNLDLLVIDSETGQLRFRMFPAVSTLESGGTYSFIHVIPSAVKELTVMPDGKTYPEQHDLGGVPIFDFGALGFVLPFLDLVEGEGFRLRTYNYSSVDSVAVYPHALENIRLPNGRTVTIRDVDVLVAGGTQLITYRVSSEAPYFYGWDYKQVKDGAPLFKMDYRGFVSAEAGAVETSQQPENLQQSNLP
ncbi:MAG: hypothetical protein DHS20C04_05920 [Hyphococcus sp.]|nr:MAG: hypothetical protein DHS20C04_05920 [Marinicaulis sp.]